MNLITDCKDPNDTFVDDNGVEYTMDDFRPSPEEELQDGECICGAFNCHTEYECWTSGY